MPSVHTPHRSTLDTDCVEIDRITQLFENRPADETGAYPLVDGVEAFAIRQALVRHAKHTLDLLYYALEKGLTSRLLARDLIEAADRGVKIRILLDDMDTLSFNQSMSLINTHSNIEVRVFNPVRKWRNNRFTRAWMFLKHIKTSHRRMHNKLWISDEILGIMGGRNLSDRYFNASDTDNFSDIDVLLAGAAAHQMQAHFDAYWTSDNTLPIQAFNDNPFQLSDKSIKHMIRRINRLTKKERVEKHPYLTALAEAQNKILPKALSQMAWGQTTVYMDPPYKINQPPRSLQIELANDHTHEDPMTPAFNELVRAIRQTRHELIIVNSYFLPGLELTQLLIELVDRGCKVMVITNSLESNDVPMIHAHYDAYRRRLMAAGVQMYEFRGYPILPKDRPQWRNPVFTWKGSRAALHSKAAVIDGSISYVGSLNLDPRSILWNTEVGTVIEQRELAQKLRHYMLAATSPKYTYQLHLSTTQQLTWTTREKYTPKRSKKAEPTHAPSVIVTLDHEPGNLWRRFQKWIGRLVPEYLL